MYRDRGSGRTASNTGTEPLPSESEDKTQLLDKLMATLIKCIQSGLYGI